MHDFLSGKIKVGKPTGLFSAAEPAKTAELLFSAAAKNVLDAGREVWKYYFMMEDANSNASFYDIKEYFQGRNDKGKMNTSSNDKIYTELMERLKDYMIILGEEIKPKVYEYGFLK